MDKLTRESQIQVGTFIRFNSTNSGYPEIAKVTEIIGKGCQCDGVTTGARSFFDDTTKLIESGVQIVTHEEVIEFFKSQIRAAEERIAVLQHNLETFRKDS